MSGTSPIEVLLVEDDEDDAFIAQAYLREAGTEFKVTWVDGADRALESLDTGQFDAALIDYQLGGATGIEVLTAARAAGIMIPMIMLTGNVNPDVDRKALESGAADFIDKNALSSAILVRTLRYAVERFRSESLLLRAARILDASRDEIFLLDELGDHIIQMNAPARARAGDKKRFSDIVRLNGPPLSERIDPDGNRTVLMEDQIAGEQHLAAGEVIPVEVDFQFFSHEDPPVILATVVDVSERRAQENNLRRAQRMEAVGQLSGGLAHDFNNLLTVISGNLELLSLDLEPDGGEPMELVEEALTAARRGADLTHRLLAFARQQPLAPKTIDPAGVVEKLAPLLKRTLGQQINVAVEIEPGLLAVTLDEAQFESAILNLGINARDAMPNGGNLTILLNSTTLATRQEMNGLAADPGPYMRVSVTDDGSGIPANILPKVLDPFFSTKGAGRGSGLGLSMVYGFIKQSGGLIDIDSTEGVGTSITLYLPSTEAEYEATPEKAARTVVAAASECILVVEDERAVRRLAARALRSAGYRTIEVENADEALEFLNNGVEFDMLFTDLYFPGENTIEALMAAITEMRPDCPVLLTSGFAARHSAKELENVPFLAKPYTPAQLTEQVEAILSDSIGAGTTRFTSLSKQA